MLVLLAQPFATDVFENAEPFVQVESAGGFTIQKRPIKGSPFAEYRVVTETSFTVAQLCEHIYEWGTKGTDHPNLKFFKVLKDTPDERVIYNQIEQPVVSNRDYAMTVSRFRDANGDCRILFRVTNELAPAAPSGFVRMSKLWGSWRFEALEHGKSRLTYTLFADPAGSIPSVLVHGSQKSATKDAVVAGLEKVKQAVAGARR